MTETKPLKNNWKQITYPIVSLTVLCLLVAFSIASTHALTHERIAYLQEVALAQGMERLIVADRYEEVFRDEINDFAIFQALSEQGEVMGHLILTYVFGYSSEVLVMTAISQGSIVAIEVVDASGETPGLGTNILDPTFKGHFQNLTVAPTLVRGEPVNEGEIQALTGATISAQAVVDAVALAMDLYDTHIMQLP
jgi:electron transport complex protein RnfG